MEDTKGIEEQLISRIRSLYKETRVATRTKEGTTSSFITKKGVRQGCVLSPTLFNLYRSGGRQILREERNRRYKIREGQDMVTNMPIIWSYW